MSRKIHRAIADSTHTTVVVETSSSGGAKFGQPVRLATLRLANEDIGVLREPKIHGHSRIELIDWYEVDARSTGPRSRYGQTLEHLLDKLPDRVAAPLIDTGVIPERDKLYIGRVVDKWKEQLPSIGQREELDSDTAPCSWSPPRRAAGIAVPVHGEAEEVGVLARGMARRL